MALRIGITGNIGAGKTTVCIEFQRLGVPVYYADREAKRLMTTDDDLRKAIAFAFGAQSYLEAGGLNRGYLADRVFRDPAALRQLNALVHPAVARDALRWHNEQSSAPYTLHEAAILFEIGATAAYGGMVVVTCPERIRRARVLARDGDGAQFDRRGAEQWDEARKAAAADYLIHNDGRHLLLPQVLRLDRLLQDRQRDPSTDRT